MPYWTYILANRPRGAIYVGVTSDIFGRVCEHRASQARSHTSRYKITQLVWFE